MGVRTHAPDLLSNSMKIQCWYPSYLRSLPVTLVIIHRKRWFPRFQESADNFEFSAERLSENAKSIKITLFAELLTAISPIYVQSLLNLSIKTLKHTICSTKMPHWHQILVIFMIYAILSRNFAVRMYALFPQISLDWKTEFRRRYPFLDVCLQGGLEVCVFLVFI